MKKCWILFFTIFLVGMFPQAVLGDSVHVEGRWGDDRIRTIFPQIPEVSVEGSVLSVYCTDSLSDLTVEVIDAEGNVILQECVTISSGETVSFELDNVAGNYQVRLSHQYGCLQGDFVLL